jgi:hypothetical protein
VAEEAVEFMVDMKKRERYRKGQRQGTSKDQCQSSAPIIYFFHLGHTS